MLCRHRHRRLLLRHLDGLFQRELQSLLCNAAEHRCDTKGYEYNLFHFICIGAAKMSHYYIHRPQIAINRLFASKSVHFFDTALYFFFTNPWDITKLMQGARQLVIFDQLGKNFEKLGDSLIIV